MLWGVYYDKAKAELQFAQHEHLEGAWIYILRDIGPIRHFIFHLDARHGSTVHQARSRGYRYVPDRCYRSDAF